MKAAEADEDLKAAESANVTKKGRAERSFQEKPGEGRDEDLVL